MREKLAVELATPAGSYRASSTSRRSTSGSPRLESVGAPPRARSAAWRRGSRHCSQSAARRGGACRRGRRARAGAAGSLPAAQRGRAARAAPRVRRGACAAAARRARSAAPRSRRARSRGARGARRRGALLEERLRRSTGLSPSARGCRLRLVRWRRMGERIALSLLDVEPGMERAVAAALRQRASAVVADDTAGRSRCSSERGRGLGSLVVARWPPTRHSCVAQMPVVAKEELLASPVARGDARRVRLRPGARRAVVRGRDRRGAAARAPGSPAVARVRARRAPRAARGSDPGHRVFARARSARRRAASRSQSGSLARTRSLGRTPRSAASREDVDAGAARSGELGAELRRLGAAEVELRQELAAASEAVSDDRGRGGAPRSRGRRGAPAPRAAKAGSTAEEPPMPSGDRGACRAAEGDDREQLAATVERLERRRERSARSTRSRTRSTKRRRSGSRSSSRSGPISRRASTSSRSCATS